MVLLQIESGTFVPNIIKIGAHFDLFIVKRKKVPFLKHSVERENR